MLLVENWCLFVVSCSLRKTIVVKTCNKLYTFCNANYLYWQPHYSALKYYSASVLLYCAQKLEFLAIESSVCWIATVYRNLLKVALRLFYY